MGDGVLIYFGYPQAHEDDAERAVRAGLELVAAVGALKTHALCAKVLKLEEVPHELPSALRNDHAVRLSNALQARRKVRRLANDCLLLRSARSDQIADYN